VTAQLILRTDASAELGTGHVMRCLALALAWVGSGGAATFVSRLPEPLARRIRAEGIGLVEIGCGPGDAEDLRTVDRLARSGERPWIVLDGYHFSPGYSSALRKLGRVLAINDYGAATAIQADLHLDQNLDGGRPGGYPEEELVLLGPAYALLRPEFQNRPARACLRPCRQVLVTLGGSDPANLTGTVLEILAKVLPQGARCLAVLGAANPRAAEVELLTRRLGPAFEARTGVADMAALMAETDLAVAAAGSTVWELACMGVPCLALPLADNQVPVARGLERWGAAATLPPGPGLDEARFAQLAAALVADDARRAALAEAGLRLVDGQGAGRVVRAMRALSDPLPAALPLAPAGPEDSRDVWLLASQPSVRANALRPGPIPWADHERWFARHMAAPDSIFLLCRLGGVLAGQIRFERQDGAALVSFSVARPFRGRGLGRRLLTATWREACRNLGLERARGLVLAGNAPSAACFRHAGFRLLGSENHGGREFLVFEGECA